MKEQYGLRIEAPHFVCRLEITNGVVTMAAPIAKYMRGWDVERVLEYVAYRKWRVVELGGPPL